MSKTVSLVVLIEVKPGQAADQITSFNKLAPLVRAEPGCLQYDLKRVAGSDTRFVLLEEWASQEELDVHRTVPHMVEAFASYPAFRASPATVLHVTDL